jgi:hypothetical protein
MAAASDCSATKMKTNDLKIRILQIRAASRGRGTYYSCESQVHVLADRHDIAFLVKLITQACLCAIFARL